MQLSGAIQLKYILLALQTVEKVYQGNNMSSIQDWSDTTEIYFTCTTLQLQIAVRDSGESISGETVFMFLLCHSQD
jgi:hypothetical protein